MSLLTTVYLCLDLVSIIARGNKERSDVKRKLLLRVMYSQRQKIATYCSPMRFGVDQNSPGRSDVLRSGDTTVVYLKYSKYVLARIIERSITDK